MKFLIYLCKEFARILLKKGHKEHSDLSRGIVLYNNTPSSVKKNRLKCLREIIMLFNYWNAFPDTYFRYGMFLKKNTNREWMKSFVPQDAYYRFSEDEDARYHLLIDDKIIFHDIMNYYGLPVPVRYFSFRDDVFRSGTKILSDAEVDAILSKIRDERIFVKRFTGGGASGVFVFNRIADGKFVDDNEDIVSASMIRKKYSGQDFFFEKQLIQEPVLSKFNPDTVNTIRVLTYNGKVIAASVRFGNKGGFVDNLAKGGVGVSLDITTGMLESYGLREYDLNKYFEHPDSHLKFENTCVPQWFQVKELVETTMQYMPYYTSVGFDVATTNHGPIIIEINTGTGIYLSEMGKKEGLAKYFVKK